MSAPVSPSLLRDVTEVERVLSHPGATMMRFSDEQRECIFAPMQPGVIVAGAGSGKTSVMTARIVWLVGTGRVTPGEVLGLTFTNKAAGELGQRVRTALRALGNQAGLDHPMEDFGEPTISTYHAYAGGLISEHGLRLGIEPDLRVVPDATRYQIAARVVSSFCGHRDHLGTNLSAVVQDVIALDNRMSEHLVEADDLRRFHSDFRAGLAGERQIKHVVRAHDTTRKRDELIDLVHAYREAKAAAGVAEFADQMAGGAQLARRCPEVGGTERQRFKVVLLDEYQDTSVSQREMLQGLFSDLLDPRGLGHPVTAVGDPCQAIYGWRGASVDNIENFPFHFPLADSSPSPRYSLSVNRRCPTRVLDTANDLARPLYAQHEGIEALVAKHDATAGRLRVSLHETVVDEIQWLVDEVPALQQQRLAYDVEATWSGIALLVRNRSEIGVLAARLRRSGVPVEVLGLAGLLSQPEVADVLATLRVVHDLTANADLLRLLTGPRWRIGVRDLALLGRRARVLVGTYDQHDGDPAQTLDEVLEAAVHGADPTEIESLWDAVADPGDYPYSTQALERLALLTSETEMLRRHAGEPLLDLVRRIIDTLGIETELAAVAGPDSVLARDNLSLLVETVADFSGHDPYASLHGLLAYLDAEADYNGGLSVAEPSQTNAVKLLTVHTAKGLEFDTVVLPFLSEGVFPSGLSDSRWEFDAAQVPGPLRGDAHALPVLGEWSTSGLKAYGEECRERKLMEELRLAYVGVTRSMGTLVASGHRWGRTQKKPRNLSPYLTTIRAHAATGELGPCFDAEIPLGSDNPVVATRGPVAFPGRLDATLIGRRRAVADAVRSAMAGHRVEDPSVETLTPADRARLADIRALDHEIETLLAEHRNHAEGTIEIDLPPVVSASMLMRLAADPDALAHAIARPLPRKPSSAARFGTRFHAWVEGHFGQQELLGPDELPGRAETDIADDADLAELIQRFRSGPFADRKPTTIEAPFSLLLGGQLVAGRIDAVYDTADGFEVVDWKTNRRHDADPVQLAVYRLAWAESAGVPVERVGAAFYYVRTGDIIRPEGLAGRAELEALFG